MSDVVPIRLRRPNLGNSTGVVSLYTVLELSAEDFCQAVSLIAQFRDQIYGGMIPKNSSIAVIGGEIGNLRKKCEALGLNATLAQIERVNAMVGGDFGWKIFADAVMEISARLRDELAARKCYIVSSERNSFIDGNGFADCVGVRFPDAIPDMDEAARCFAFERPTACIFHLMRVTEYGLNAIADLLGINDHSPTWEPIIRKIDAELKLDYSKRQFKGSQDLLANMSTHLHAVKVAWRNKTMHVEKINTMEHAREIYNATTGLMRYLAENLPQKKGIVQSIKDFVSPK
jgi:hypothetical protein